MVTIADPTEWTVLVVEDEPDNLGIPEGILKFYGAKVHTARDGQHGLNVLASVTPSFILLDLSMPNIDGWQMLKAVRANPETTDVPVIALTAHAMEGNREKALAAGFDGYITKPIMLHTFLEQIKESLREAGRSRGDGAAPVAESTTRQRNQR